MPCYNDKLYCQAWKVCAKGNGCPDALTPEVEQAAEDEGLPVMTYREAPNCFEVEEIMNKLNEGWGD